MVEHHIHDEKIVFHSGTEEARSWLQQGVTREGLKQLQRRAERGEEAHFTDPSGKKFELKHDPESGLSSVHRRY